MRALVVTRLLLLVLLAASLMGPAAFGCAAPVDDAASGGSPSSATATGDAAFAEGFRDRAHDVEVEGQGTVERILDDDTEGDRHQRFVVRLASGQTLLIAHNIDVAPRVEDLRVGDTVEFGGVYEWSEEGGTVHWTHHDPDGSHAPGWIRHGGRTYE